MRLIDADAFERRCMFDASIEDMQDVIYALRDYPGIELVRCKDCVAYGEMLSKVDKRMICHKWAINFPEDFYCADAERRNDG